MEVVIPARDAGAFIGETLDSLRSSSFQAWKAWVVDDGSRDHTAAIAENTGDPRVALLKSTGIGAPGARNRGLDEVRADFVLFLDADDRLPASSLQRLYTTLCEHPASVLSYGRETLISDSGSPFGFPAPVARGRYPSGNVLSTILADCFIPTPGAALLRTSAVRELGGFTPGLPASQDWELWCRMAMLGEFSYVGATPIIAHRIPAAALSRVASPERYQAANRAVFSHPGIRGRFTAEELAGLKRRREARNYHNSAKEALRRTDWQAALAWSRGSLVRQPWNPRAIVIGCCALLRYVPPFVRQRLGIL